MSDEAEPVRMSANQRWRALRGAIKKIARDLQYRTPPHGRMLRHIVLEHEQAALLLGYITLKLEGRGFAGWQSVGLDDDARTDVLRMADTLEAWITFLNAWHERQLMIDALHQSPVVRTDEKKADPFLALAEHRAKLIDDLRTAATKLRTLAKP